MPVKVLWPKSVAPFAIHILPVDKQGTDGFKLACEIEEALENRKYEVILDDRNESLGVKLNDADLIGCMYRIIIGRKAKDGILELKNMETNEIQELTIDDIKNYQY